MKESSIIVANWAHGLSDQPCGSPEGNVLAVARRGHAGGLASGWAVTGFGIASSTVRRPHMNMVCGTEWERRIRGARMKTRFLDKLDGCVLEAPRCIGNGTATLIAVQSGDSPCSVTQASIGMPLCQRWLLGHGLAHEVVVAMMSAITSRESEGPLGYRGHRRHGVPE